MLKKIVVFEKDKNFAWPRSWQIIAFWMLLGIPWKIYSIAKKSLKILWTETKKKRQNMAFFNSSDNIFGISVEVTLNFNDILVATDTTIYFEILPIDIFIKNLFPDDL